MYPGAGRTGDRLVLVFGNIWIVIQLVLDVEAGRRAPENELAHLVEIDGLAARDHDLAQGSANGLSAILSGACVPADSPVRH